MTLDTALPAPGAGLDPGTMPAHWLLARLGKKVMRPGGGVVSEAMLEGLAIGPADDVVDLAPGLGTTVQRVQALRPASFRGIERGEAEAERARRQVSDVPYSCVVASPAQTGLPRGSASVVYGEACLSLETDATKQRIIAEAARVLRPGGRFGLHELLLRPDDLPAEEKRRIGIAISRSVRVGARPLTQAEWITLLTEGGFAVKTIHRAPLLLLSPATVVRDEGVVGAAVLTGRVVRDKVVLRRVAHLWRTMHRERRHLGSISLVAVREA
jgi:SAM-dependent methyltransferase